MPPVPVPTRTSSGRQRRTTKRENYRNDEAQEAARRKEEKQKKVQKKADKTARQARQQQADSDGDNQVADDEVNLSDADLDEDTMKRPDKAFPSERVFTSNDFARKTTSNSRIRNSPPRLSTVGDDDEVPATTDEDDDDDEITASGIKRGRQDFDDGNIVDPKAQMGNDGSKRRTKASDFDEFTQDVLSVAIAVFRCLVCTTAPFPETTAIETKMAEQAWAEACRRTGLNIRLTPAIHKMITKRTSHVRSELKTKARALTATFFAFRSGGHKSTIVRNRQRAEDLKEKDLFAYLDTELRKGLYKTEIIQLVLNDMWFTNRLDEGILYHEFFNPIPVETIALILTAIECCIDEWATGIKEDIKFSAAAYGSVYRAHLSSLTKFGEHTKKYNLLEKLSQRLHTNARFYSGAEPIKQREALSHDAFEAAMREYEEDSATEPESDEEPGEGPVDEDEQDGGVGDVM
ncbi:hypothetical protein BJ138DRAFT_1119639 [Hygrophoropsis aurantiaca]|uniref:Uncharacterized protein n=1 Tax=Hygrophoropsis aurantiaca TaxID=72124 RepID=A0ACB7ZSZ7_9AGAM|nr:hypothetical protein BJ138DRAFT_1119639 [Hygrophoropsis aurantiaca]